MEDDESMRLSSIENMAKKLPQIDMPTVRDSLRQMAPMLSIRTAAYFITSGIATRAPIFYLLAAGSVACFFWSAFKWKSNKKPMGYGETVVTAISQILTEDAVYVRGKNPSPETEARLEALQKQLDETKQRLADAHKRNRHKIMTVTIALAVLLAIPIGVMAVYNYQERKAEAAYAQLPEWVRMRDACLAAGPQADPGGKARHAVVSAMLQAGEPAEAETFYFAYCQGGVGDFECATVIALYYRTKQDPQAFEAFRKRVSLRYDSDTRKIRNMKYR